MKKYPITENPPLEGGRPKGAKSFNPKHGIAFGDVLRRVRKEKGISQDKLAYTAGIERSYIGRLERGENIPSLTLIINIANTLGVSAAELVAHTEQFIKDHADDVEIK